MKLPKYNNADTCKAQILSENKNKSGIYKWTNSTNGKRYIGSSDNLNRRFREYFNVNYLLKHQSMSICCALLKHGYFNFSLEILEYCEVSELLIREKHYWDKYTPEYNIAKDPTAPMSGRKHSDETKQILSEANKGKNLSDETKTIMSDAKKGEKKFNLNNLYIRPEFIILANVRHKKVLQLIKGYFGVGTIFHSGKNAGYRVGSVKDLISVIIPHFMKYPLLSTKACTFSLWHEAINIMHSGAHKTDTDFLKTLAIHAGINRGASRAVKTHFPDLKPALLPTYSLTISAEELSPWWISGYFTFYFIFWQDKN